MRRYWAYNRYLAIHKWYVFWAAWKLGVPWLGLLHDLSKYRPDEHRWYARHFYAPNGATQTWQGKDGFYADADNDTTFDRAWLKHIRRNRHHPQHWVRVYVFHCQCMGPGRIQFKDDRLDVLLNDDGTAQCLSCLYKGPNDLVRYHVDEMPLRYRKEMLADWIGAGMAQGTPDTRGWYAARGTHLPLGPATRAWIEAQLGVVAVSTAPECS